MNNTPALSIIIVAPRSADAIGCLLHYLKRQTVAAQLELVIVATAEIAQCLDGTQATGLLQIFCAVQIIALAEITSMSEPNAAGVRAARGAVVVFAEDHCFPASNWAEKLIEGFRLHGPAIGPAMHSANPESIVSRAQFCMTYGPWGPFATEGIKDDLPGHNSCYGRDVLLSLGDRLPELLGHEIKLHQLLREMGHELYHYTPAVVYHVNLSSAKVILCESFAGAALHSAAWRRGKNGLQRLSFSLLNIIKPLRQVRWFWRDMTFNRLSGSEKLRALPLCAGCAVLGGFGTIYGLWFPSSFAAPMMFREEYHRESLLCTADHLRYTSGGYWKSSAWEEIIP